MNTLQDKLRQTAHKIDTGKPIKPCEETALMYQAAEEIQRLEAENARMREQIPQWIPVSERLPEIGQHCVFKISLRGYKDYCEAGALDGGGNICDLCGDPTDELKNVTHWMPLPTPPEQSK